MKKHATEAAAYGRSTNEKGSPMKSMTCTQLGGPCELAHRARTADDIIKAQDRHLRESVAAGDHAHEAALNDMKGRWKRPLAGMGWYRSVKREFAALSES